ncbi:MAG: M48 family metallopeptidase [Gammaproteobacteria bacterium]|jgi:predicted Zn-dependent protease|nr:M48 family metallopeptidase [Gammaproteobacteria bacterium]MDP6617507.1 M48 family metallopeptidase [Gammaproteobacteria bacterium]MDP6695932.1 M48 family metallopeptidase [Gammaproteobacteria bacterium]
MKCLRKSLPLVLTATLAGCVTSTQLEVEAGHVFDQMRAEMPLSNSLADRSYVKCVTRAIINQLEEPYASYDWDIELFDEEKINAFAMAGGKMGIFSGLLEVTENQDQLASVIGHEIAHVTRKHTLKKANQTIITQRAVAIGASATGASANATNVAATIAQLGLLLPYSRGHESEADVVGLKYMAAAGFDPRASVTLWTNMSKAGSGGPPEILSTHPSDQTRISKLAGQLTATLPLYNQAQAAGRTPNCRH